MQIFQKKRKTIITLGVLVALVPHLALPSALAATLLTLFGILVATLAYSLKSGTNLPIKAPDMHPLATSPERDGE